MANLNNLLKLDIHLFDGGDGGAGTGAGAAGGAADAAAGTQGNPSNSREGATGEEPRIVYGKKPETEADPSTAPDAEEHGNDDPKAREARYREYISGEGKEYYQKDVQRIIDKRFKATKGLQESLDAQSPVMAILEEKYGTNDPAKLAACLNSETSLWEDKAEEAGMTVEQYRAFAAMKAQNAQLLQQQQERYGRERAAHQLQQWDEQANAVREHWDENFDLESACEDPQFMRMLNAGVPVEHAYQVLHMDEIMEAKAAESQRRTVETIRARGSRPAEAGASSQTGVIYKDDPSKWTAKDRRNVVAGVRGGKIIKL